MDSTIEEIIKKAEKGEDFHVPPALMPDYIRYLYTTHRCLHEFFHLRIEEVRQGEIKAALDLGPDYLNSGGFLYGGILAAMSDAISLGLIAGVGKSAVTTNIAMNFVKSHPAEGTIYLYGRIRHNGRRMLVLCGEIRGERGELLADMTISMYVLAPMREVPAVW